MGAYAMPDNKAFVTKGEIKRKRKRGMLDRNMQLIRENKVIINIRENKIEVEEKNEK